MTTCKLILNPITRMVEQEGKNLDEIAEEVCPKIEYGREKIIRIIKDFLGEEYLIQHATTLKYDVQKAELARKRKPKSQEKIDADCSTKNEACQLNGQKPDFLTMKLKKLVDKFSLEAVKSALAGLEAGI
jgi:hypothetical protein